MSLIRKRLHNIHHILQHTHNTQHCITRFDPNEAYEHDIERNKELDLRWRVHNYNNELFIVIFVV